MWMIRTDLGRMQSQGFFTFPGPFETPSGPARVGYGHLGRGFSEFFLVKGSFFRLM